MSNQSSFRIKVIKSGEDFQENAYITYSTSQTGIVTGGYGRRSHRARQRFMNFTSFHSSPVKITPVPSVPIVYDDNKLLSFVQNHISDEAETATLYLKHAHNHLKSSQIDLMREMPRGKVLSWYIGSII